MSNYEWDPDTTDIIEYLLLDAPDCLDCRLDLTDEVAERVGVPSTGYRVIP